MLPETFSEILSETKNRIRTRSTDHPIAIDLYGKLNGIEPDQANALMQVVTQEGIQTGRVRGLDISGMRSSTHVIVRCLKNVDAGNALTELEMNNISDQQDMLETIEMDLAAMLKPGSSIQKLEISWTFRMHAPIRLMKTLADNSIISELHLSSGNTETFLALSTMLETNTSLYLLNVYGFPPHEGITAIASVVRLSNRALKNIHLSVMGESNDAEIASMIMENPVLESISVSIDRMQDGGDLLFASLKKGSLKKIALYGSPDSSVEDFFCRENRFKQISLENSPLEEFRLTNFDLSGHVFAPVCRMLSHAPMLKVLDFSSNWLDATLAEVLTDLISHSETLESLVIKNMKCSYDTENILDRLARLADALADNTVLAILHVSFAYVSFNNAFSKLLKLLQQKNFSLQDLQLQDLDCSSLNQRNKANARVSMLSFFNRHSRGLFDSAIAHDIFARTGHQYEGDPAASCGCSLM